MNRPGVYLYDNGRRQVERFDSLEEAKTIAEDRLATASGVIGEPLWIARENGEHVLYKQQTERHWYIAGLSIREVNPAA